MDQWKEILSQLAVIGVLIYALLLVAGAPFVGPKWANGHAKFMLGLPFRIIFAPFRKKGKRKKRGR